MNMLTQQRIDQRVHAMLACFNTIYQQRMADVPILHPQLHVEAVGFRRWQEYALGVLITPWMMKLMALPLLNKPVQTTSQHWCFPAGKYQFDYEQIEDLGNCYSCSLFSPMLEFTDQQATRATAIAVMQELFTDQSAQRKKLQNSQKDRSLSRRSFLRGGH